MCDQIYLDDDNDDNDDHDDDHDHDDHDDLDHDDANDLKVKRSHLLQCALLVRWSSRTTRG